jgi:hypothetical protein
MPFCPEYAKEDTMDIVMGIVGWVGTALLIVAYALLTAGRLRAGGWMYQTMNLIGGLALLVNCVSLSAWPSAALNVVWFSIGAVGLIRSRRRRAAPATADSSAHTLVLLDQATAADLPMRRLTVSALELLR